MLTRVVLLLGVLLPVLGRAQVSDHLECYAIKDPLLSGVRKPVKSYTADLDGLVPEPGCVIKMPAKYVCVETTKANVQPPPPGAPTGPSAGQLLCYKVKCPKATLPAVTMKDQFGTREVMPKGSKLVCAPATPTTTTSTTTSTCPPATAFYCGEAGCGAVGSGCPPIFALCPSGMTCTTTGTTCTCTGESIPCGDPRLSGLTCNFCRFGTCPPGMTCGGVPKQGECGFDCACH
jgi:hypothetical protein